MNKLFKSLINVRNTERSPVFFSFFQMRLRSIWLIGAGLLEILYLYQKKIMRLISNTLLLFSFIVLCSFPLYIEYPLGEPGKDKVDKKLLGTWEVEDDSRQFFKCEIKEINKFEYRLKVLEKGKQFGLEAEEFKLYTTKFEGEEFLYLQPIGTEKNGFYYFIYKMNDKDKMIVEEIADDRIDKSALYSPEALKNYFEAKAGQSKYRTGAQLWVKR